MPKFFYFLCRRLTPLDACCAVDTLTSTCTPYRQCSPHLRLARFFLSLPRPACWHSAIVVHDWHLIIFPFVYALCYLHHLLSPSLKVFNCRARWRPRTLGGDRASTKDVHWSIPTARKPADWRQCLRGGDEGTTALVSLYPLTERAARSWPPSEGARHLADFVSLLVGAHCLFSAAPCPSGPSAALCVRLAHPPPRCSRAPCLLSRSPTSLALLPFPINKPQESGTSLPPLFLIDHVATATHFSTAAQQVPAAHLFLLRLAYEEGRCAAPFFATTTSQTDGDEGVGPSREVFFAAADPPHDDLITSSEVKDIHTSLLTPYT